MLRYFFFFFFSWAAMIHFAEIQKCCYPLKSNCQKLHSCQPIHTLEWRKHQAETSNPIWVRWHGIHFLLCPTSCFRCGGWPTDGIVVCACKECHTHVLALALFPVATSLWFQGSCGGSSPFSKSPFLLHSLAEVKKNAQRERCELNFICGKMRTRGWETAAQIALNNCSQEAGGEGQYRCDFGEGGAHAIKLIFFAEGSASLMKVSASHQEQTSPWRILVLF